jgi:alpha-1,6-mannosyltransferase
MDLSVRLPAVRTETGLAHLGLAGSILMAASSYWVAAIPIWFRTQHVPVISWLPISSAAPRIAFYAGLILLCVAWLALGRIAIEDGLDRRRMRTIGLRWMAPLIFAAPTSSRDLWAYAAQGHLVLHGLNPYTLGPSALPGVFASEVSKRWVSTPAPYGPLWLLLGKGLAAVFGDHVTMTIYALRLLTVAGMLMMAWGVPILADRAGGRAELGLWLTLANPLFLILGVAGGHNDLLMVGLMVLGLVAVTNRGPLWRTLGLGVVAITAATAIKSPAVVAAAFAVPLWLAYNHPAQRWRSARGIAGLCAIVTALTVVTFAAITAVSGLGLGWVKQVNNAAPIVTWMSIPTSLAMIFQLLHGVTHGTTKVGPVMRAFRTGGTVVTLLALVWLWARSLRQPAWTLLAIALFVVVVLGPTVQPWYFCWALAVAAAFLVDGRWLAWIGGLSVALVVMIRPNGTGFQMKPVVIVFIAGGLALSWLLMRRRERVSP